MNWKRVLNLAITLAVLTALALSGVVWADNLVNNLDTTVDPALETVTITAGGSVNVGFYIQATTGSDDASGCNATGNEPAYLTITPPAGVSVSWTGYPNPIKFVGCNNVNYVTFSSSTPGTYTISNFSMTGGKDDSKWNYETAKFTLVVQASDTTAPVITYTISGTKGNDGWYVSDVTVTWTVTDNESAITSKSGCDETTITTDTGGTTLTCTATSAGGTASQSVTIKRDATPPTISASVLPARPDSGWWNIASGAPTVTYTCNDATSGIASCTAPYTFGEGADQTHTGTATDNAGNSASAGVSDIDVDLTAPTISASVSPMRPDSGWWNIASGAPTVSFECSDALSGLAGACPADYTFGEGENQSYSQTIYDKAGNSASAGVSDIDVDLTAPTITWSSEEPADGASYYFGAVPAAPTCTASDGLSGVDGACTISGYSTAVGDHTLTATATDKAGNTQTETRTYTVLAWTLKGFYQPVDMNGVLNVVKGGSTVPLKFEIFAGATELTDTAAVKSLTYAQTTCSADAITDEIETVATGGTSLRYDWTAGQFIFNWKTPTTPGKCYRVTMTTQDGSSLQAFFKIK
jgi:hypothetical protein